MKHILLLSVLLLGATWVVAQDSSTPSSSGSQSGSSSSTSQTGSSSSSGQMGNSSSGSQMGSSAHHSVEGCLSGSDGKYTLTDKQGTTYQLTGDTSKLAEHVGHEVKVMGSTGSGSSAAGGSATGASAGGGQTLEVTSVKHVSKTCSTGGGMSK